MTGATDQPEVATAASSTPHTAWWHGRADLRPPSDWTDSSLAVPVVAGMLAVLAGVASGVAPLLALAMVLAGALTIVVVIRPVFGAYLLAGAAPVTIGLERGVYLPVVRPHEALLLLIAVGLGARWLWDNRNRPVEFRPSAIHISLVALAVASSIIPLLWLMIRGLRPSGDDLGYAFVVWKYLVLFLVIRFAVRTPKQVEWVLGIWLAGAAVVAIVAMLQVSGQLGVEQFLATHYAPLGNEAATAIQRGTSTLASSIAVGDVMAVSLAIALTWLLRGSTKRLVLAEACVLFALGAIASGQFSGIIATFVAVVVVGVITRSFGRLLLTALPVAFVGAFSLWPVIERRLAGFSSPEGLPLSWQGRLDNLHTFFWPKLFSGINWVLGVQPAGRVPAPANDGIDREFVFIESGHTFLLWTGGLPLLLAFFAFLFIVLKQTLAIARARFDSIGVAAAATAAAAWIIFVLAFLDMHLTLRGMGDLFFTLLALSLTTWRRAGQQPSPEVEA